MLQLITRESLDVFMSMFQFTEMRATLLKILTSLQKKLKLKGQTDAGCIYMSSEQGYSQN